MGYDVIARFYDDIVGDRTASIQTVKNLIQQRVDSGASILELGCGTGSILYTLRNQYKVSGLDSSEQMLSIARQRLDNAKLYNADITSFSLREKYNVILCVFDSINHLTSWHSWKAVFRRARAHLKDRGLFIFDVNTEKKLRSLEESPAWVVKFDNHFSIIDVLRCDSERTRWNIRVFEKLQNDLFKLHCAEIIQRAYPIGVISGELKSYFSQIDAIDSQGDRGSDSSERVYFVCQNF